MPVEEGQPVRGRRKYSYEVRSFKIEDGKSHECSGEIVAVLSSTYSQERKTWYLAVLIRHTRELTGMTPEE